MESKIVVKKLELEEEGKKHSCRVTLYNDSEQNIKSIQLMVEIAKTEKSRFIKVGFDGLFFEGKTEMVREFPLKQYEEDDMLRVTVVQYTTDEGDKWEAAPDAQPAADIDWTIKKKEFFVIDSLANYEYEDDFVDKVEEFLSVAEQPPEPVKLPHIPPALKKKLLIGGGVFLGLLIIFLSYRSFSKNAEFSKVYVAALDMIEKGNYDEAYEKLLTIKDYSKANALVLAIEERQATYQKALELNNRKDWEAAAELFYKILDYKDAKEYYDKNPVVMEYTANKAFVSMDYNTAISKYKELLENFGVDKDIPEKVQKADDTYAKFMGLLRDSKLKEALTQYRNLKYKDAEVVLAYVEAKLIYNEDIKDKEAAQVSVDKGRRVYELLQKIPYDYKGDYSEKIAEFKLNVESKVEKYKEP